MQLTSFFKAALLSATLLFNPVNLFAQSGSNPGDELLYGTWVLDLSRSVFIEREPPKSQVLIFEPSDEGLKATVIFTDQDGKEDRITYVANEAGQPAQLSGSENFDTIILESTDPYHATSVFTHAGMEVGRSQRTISLNGQEMMVEVERKGNLSSRAIFVKQK